MNNPLLMKLEQFSSFDDRERRRLDQLISERQRTYAPRQDILVEGQNVDTIHIVLSGLAARYKLLERRATDHGLPGSRRRLRS